MYGTNGKPQAVHRGTATERGLLIGIGPLGIHAAQRAAELVGRVGLLLVDPSGGASPTWAARLVSFDDRRPYHRTAGHDDRALVVRQLVRHLLHRDESAPETTGPARLACQVFCDLEAHRNVELLEGLLKLISEEALAPDLTVFGLIPRAANSETDLPCREAFAAFRRALEWECAVQRVFVVDGHDEAGWWVRDPVEVAEIAALAAACGLAPPVAGELRKLLVSRISPGEPPAHSWGSVGVRRFHVGASALSDRLRALVAQALRSAPPDVVARAEDNAAKVAEEVAKHYNTEQEEGAQDLPQGAVEAVERGLTRALGGAVPANPARATAAVRRFLESLATELEQRAPTGMWAQQQLAKEAQVLRDIFDITWGPIQKAPPPRPPVRRFLTPIRPLLTGTLVAAILACCTLAGFLAWPLLLSKFTWPLFLVPVSASLLLACLCLAPLGRPYVGEVEPGTVASYLAVPSATRLRLGIACVIASAGLAAWSGWKLWKLHAASLHLLAEAVATPPPSRFWAVLTAPLRGMCILLAHWPFLAGGLVLFFGLSCVAALWLLRARPSINGASSLRDGLDHALWPAWVVASGLFVLAFSLLALATEVIVMGLDPLYVALFNVGLGLSVVGVLLAIFPSVRRHREPVLAKPQVPPRPAAVPPPREGCERIIRWARNLTAPPRTIGPVESEPTLVDWLAPGWTEDAVRGCLDVLFGRNSEEARLRIVATLMHELNASDPETLSLEEILARVAVEQWLHQESWPVLLRLIADGDAALRSRLRAMVPVSWDGVAPRPWRDVLVLFPISDDTGRMLAGIRRDPGTVRTPTTAGTATVPLHGGRQVRTAAPRPNGAGAFGSDRPTAPVILDLSNPDEPLLERISALLSPDAGFSSTVLAVRYAQGLSSLSAPMLPPRR